MILLCKLQTECITSVTDLADFNSNALQQLTDLQCPGGRVPDPHPGVAPGMTIATPSFCLWGQITADDDLHKATAENCNEEIQDII